MAKLLPSASQTEAREATLCRVNAACDYVSGVAWETRTFGKYALQKMPFVCDERTSTLLEHRRGESDLVHRDGKWYLLAVVEVGEPPSGTPEDWLGVDLGIRNIASDSAGEAYSGGELRGLRNRYQRVRSRLQSKGTKSAKRLLRKRRRREHRMCRDTNHRISKRIVEKAQRTKSGIALEDLKGIRGRVRARRSQRSTLHSWSFHQLRSFIEYKARLAGVPVVHVDPRNTSRTCPECGCGHKRNRSGTDTFCCVSCSFAGDADTIAAINIGSRAHVMVPNVSESKDATHAPSSISRDKPAALAVGS